MTWLLLNRAGPFIIAVCISMLFNVPVTHAMIEGLSGNAFSFTAKAGYISGADGQSIYIWGYANGDGPVQYSGPTLILQQGVQVTVQLKNELAEPVSIVFPGQVGVTAAGGVPGLLAQEAPPDGNTVVTYTFTPTHAGTYHYHSGSHIDIHVEMGLVGAIIVRPTGFNPASPQAYEHASSAYDHEYLFLLTEMDLKIHRLIEFGALDQAETTIFHPVYWFINGRNAPDTMLPNNIPWFPHQPYNCMPRMHPGEKLLMRVIGAGRDLHPYHTHGNNVTIIAKDGRLLESAPGAGADLAYSDFTITTVPGQTVDAIFEWTGKGLGWDIYGHSPNDPILPHEYAPDHGKPFPVILPELQEMTLGGAYSGSPFLGAMGDIPPGQGGDNLNSGYFYMWHSHNEVEMVNNDVFPGGMMTMLIIEPPGVPIP
jgi:FtsP/CotA-like multicopper oxidase with cupredoxin domain